MIKLHRILTLLLFLFLCGCATNTTSLFAPGPQTKSAEGLFSVITPQTAQSGHFLWTQNGADFSLELYGPLGLGATYLSQIGDDVVLKTANGQTYNADSAEDLLTQVLGWSMPVSGFTSWLWGKPAPGFPFNATYDDQNRILSLQQEGWSITYTWSEAGSVPSRLTLIRNSIKVKILMD